MNKLLNNKWIFLTTTLIICGYLLYSSDEPRLRSIVNDQHKTLGKVEFIKELRESNCVLGPEGGVYAYGSVNHTKVVCEKKVVGGVIKLVKLVEFVETIEDLILEGSMP